MGSEFVVGQGSAAKEQPQRGGTFLVMAVLTIGIGVALAATGILHLKAPPAQIIQSEPVVKEIKVPGPAPEPIIREVKVREPAAPVVAAPVPLQQAGPGGGQFWTGKGEWDGVWRQRSLAFPAFRLVTMANGIAGDCIPNWAESVSFQVDEAEEKSIRFLADNGVFRLRFQMTKEGDNRVKIEAWMTDEDWVFCLERLKKKARNQQELLLGQAVLADNWRRYRKRNNLGTFYRQGNEEGK
jgi:hypothetical protein